MEDATASAPDYRKEVAKLRALDGVVGAAPAILGKALLRTERGDAFVTLKGIDPALEPEVTDLGRSMTAGQRRATSKPRSEADVPGILIGVDLAKDLGLAVGDSVTLLTPEGTLSPMGMMPRARRLRVAGIFRLGLYDFDAASGFVTPRDGRTAARILPPAWWSSRCATSTPRPPSPNGWPRRWAPTTRPRTGPT